MNTTSQYTLLLEFFKERYPKIINVERVQQQFAEWIQQKGINTSIKLGRRRKYPFNTLAIDEFFLVEGGNIQSISSALVFYRRRNKSLAQFKISKLEDRKIIVKRLEDKVETV